MSLGWPFLGRLALAAPTLLLGCAARETRTAGRELEALVEDRAGVELDGLAQARPTEAMAAFVRRRLQDGLTRDEAVVLGLLGNRGLQASFTALGVAQADLIQAGLLRNPRLDLHLRFAGGGLFPEFSVVQALMDAFLIPARRKLARVQLEQAKLELAREALELRAEILRAVVTLQALQALWRIRTESVEAAELAAELGAAQLRAGTMFELDAATLQAAYHRSAQILIETETALVGARERINELLGLWGEDTAWELREPLPADAGEPMLAGLESIAVTQRLDIAAARQQLDAMVRSANLARAGKFAVLEPGFTYERDLDGDRALGPVIELDAPIFDWGRADVTRIQARITWAQRRLEALAIHARSEIRGSYVELVNHRRMARFYQSTLVPLQASIVERAQVRYNAMLLGVYDLLRAKQDELAARERAIEALRDYWLARTRLELAVGGCLPAPREPGPRK